MALRCGALLTPLAVGVRDEAIPRVQVVELLLGDAKLPARKVASEGLPRRVVELVNHLNLARQKPKPRVKVLLELCDCLGRPVGVRQVERLRLQTWRFIPRRSEGAATVTAARRGVGARA